MKTTLYLDFDSTLVNSDKAFCEAYNDFYQNHVGFVRAREEDATDWVFKRACPLLHTLHVDPYQAVMGIFGSDSFFDHLEFYRGAKEAVERLIEHYHIVICTSASPKNGSRKLLWIERHLPMVDEVIILINHKQQGVGKARVPMMEEGAIFIDDHPKNLHSTKATRKILFKARESEYSDGWKGEVHTDWTVLTEALLEPFKSGEGA